jgi:hypothetical protein
MKTKNQSVKTCRKSILGRRKSRCKSPEVGSSFAYVRIRPKAGGWTVIDE